MADRLSGKVAIITGGNSGIGEGIGRAFAAEGAKVILMARREAQGRAVAARIQDEGGIATFIACDVSEVASVEAAVAAAAETHSAVDILINNAGGGGGGTFPDESTEQFSRVVHLNLMGTFYMSRAVWPHLIGAGGGAVVNMSSQSCPPEPDGHLLYESRGLATPHRCRRRRRRQHVIARGPARLQPEDAR